MFAAAMVFVVLAGSGQGSPPFPPSGAPGGVGASEYSFRTPTGLLVFHVRPERASDFEVVMSRLAHGLASSADAVRRRQRDGWRLMRSGEGPAETAVYVLVLDPTVASADYDPVRLLTELWPNEARALYERLREAVVKVERIGLTAVAEFGSPAAR